MMFAIKKLVIVLEYLHMVNKILLHIRCKTEFTSIKSWKDE